MNSPSILQIWSDGFDSFCNKFRCSHFHHDLNHCLTLQLFGPLTCYASTPVCGTVRGSNYKFSQLLFELQIFLSFFPSSLSKFAEIALNLFNDCMLKIKFNKIYLISVKILFDEKNWKFCRSCFGPWCDQLQRGWYNIGILNSCQRILLGPVCQKLEFLPWEDNWILNVGQQQFSLANTNIHEWEKNQPWIHLGLPVGVF